MITLVLGGTRSGKSEVAEALLADAGAVTYVATGHATDPDMAARIDAHQRRRPDLWTTVEAGADLATALDAAEGPALVDSLGTWVAAHPDLRPDLDALTAALRRRAARAVGPTVIVSEEVGMGVHAPTDVGRRFTDALGTVNRAVADVADRALLVVAGRVLPLERAVPGS